MIDIFAFQEALLIEVIFGIALLAMIWVGFRRWLQYKEKVGRLIGEQMAERALQHGARIDRVEERLKAVEQRTEGVQTRIGELGTNALSEQALKHNEVDPDQ